MSVCALSLPIRDDRARILYVAFRITTGRRMLK
jgi:hypothetical protein